MSAAVPANPDQQAGEAELARAGAVAALHLVALRRQFDAIRQVFGDSPPHRAREALWAVLEVVVAERRGRPIAIRDLVARSGGLLSAPTLSRIVADLERDGFLAAEAAGRRKLLRPTARTIAILAARADDAFREFGAVLGEAMRGSAPEGATRDP